MVYTNMKLLQSYLTHPSFKLTGSRKEADILWLTDHFKDFRYARTAWWRPLPNTYLQVTLTRKVHQSVCLRKCVHLQGSPSNHFQTSQSVRGILKVWSYFSSTMAAADFQSLIWNSSLCATLSGEKRKVIKRESWGCCLLYTSDAADE